MCQCGHDDPNCDEELNDEIEFMEKAMPWVFGALITALVCAVFSLPVLGYIQTQDFKQLHSNCEVNLHEVAP